MGDITRLGILTRLESPAHLGPPHSGTPLKD